MTLGRYLVKKPLSQIQAESQTQDLKRSLSALNLVSLGVGCIIGAGIFVLTGSAAANHAGPAIMLSFVLVAVACAIVAVCYAELASVLPVSGSAYTYAYATLGEAAAWAMGWLLILEYGLASATVAVGWSGYLNNILMSMNFFIPPQWVAPYGTEVVANQTFRAIYEAHGYGIDAKGLLTMGGEVVKGIFNTPAFIGISIVTGLLVYGISESAKVNNIMVLIKVSVVVLFIVIGAFYIDPANWTPFIPDAVPVDPAHPDGPMKYGASGILAGAGAIFFAYIGFESVSTAAQEAKNPPKDIPIGILGSLAICTILYICVAAVLTGVVPYGQLGVAEPIALAVDHMNLPWFSYFIKLGAIAGLSSVMLWLLYAQTRVFFMISKDGLLPAFFSKLHPKFKTPHINTVVVGLGVGVASALTPIRVLGDLVSMGTLFAFVIVCFSMLYLRYKEPKLHRPYRTPFVPFVPLAGIALCFYLMWGLGAHVFVQLKIWFIFGIVFYLAYSQFKSKLGREYKTLGAPVMAGVAAARNSKVGGKDMKKKAAGMKAKAELKMTVKKTATKKPAKKK